MRARTINTLLGAAIPLLVLLGPALASDAEQRAMALIKAYPDFLASFADNKIVWRDGTRMDFDDGKAKKPFKTLLNAPDLEDQFYAPYPSGAPATQPAKNSDPGRVRYEPMFTKMYGNCKKGGTRANMAKVKWFGRTLRITRINGVAEKLQAVAKELEQLGPAYRKYLTPSGGTYNCRTIAGTKRFSVHAFAAAIDINTKFTNYWRWSKPDGKGHYKFKNRIPIEIVKVFEKHHFIWGGRWYHYDTMHFEYRPEFFLLR